MRLDDRFATGHARAASIPASRVGGVSAHLAALIGVVAAGVGIGIYLLVQVPLFYVACGVVLLVAVLLAVGFDPDALDRPQ